MSDGKIEDILAALSPAAKKEMLDTLVYSLLRGLSEAEKQEMLKTVVSGKKEDQSLLSMAEY
ncbi:MAG: hypothetical protein HZA17_12370 [Nitrospirae bacterium]|nr:hypothetical protein [Nitrospirota bacterium]